MQISLFKIFPIFFIILFTYNKLFATDTFYNFQCPDGSNPTGTSTTSSYTNGSFGTGTFNRVIGGYNFNIAWYQNSNYYPNPKLHSTSPAESINNDGAVTFSTVEIYRYYNTPSMGFRAYWTAKVYTCPLICDDGAPALDGKCDRSCEDVGLFTKFVKISPLEPESKQCVQSLSYDDSKTSCITNCGSAENVKNFNYIPSFSSTPSTYSCECLKADDLVDLTSQIPNIDTTQNTTQPNNDSTNLTLSSIDSLITDKLNNLDFSDTNNATDSDMQNLLESQDMTNSILGTISDNLDSLNSNLDNDNTDITDRLDDIISNQDSALNYQKLKDTATTETFNNYLSNLQNFYDEKNSTLQDVQGFADDLKSSYFGFVSSVEGVISDFNNGFSFSTTSTSKPSCGSFSLWGQNISIDICSLIGNFQNVFSLLIQCILYYASIKIFILAFRTVRV